MVIRNFEGWFSSRGDDTLRLNYRLNKESIIFDVGSYTGEWAEKMANRYGCRIYCFEPIREFYEATVARCSKLPNVQVKNYAIGTQNSSSSMILNGNSSSLVFDSSGSSQTETVNIRSLDSVMDELGISNVDLLKINIEGYEYDLMDYICGKGMQSKFANLQIQFHLEFPNAEERYSSIASCLEKTHGLTYRFDFIWENWQIK